MAARNVSNRPKVAGLKTDAIFAAPQRKGLATVNISWVGKTLCQRIDRSVIPGPNSPEQFPQIHQWMRVDVPADLWAELKAEKLIAENAPTPG